MAIVITQADFKEIGQLTAHCDKTKLDIAVQEAIIFDMERLFCDFWLDIEDNWDSVEAIWTELINGTDYVGCADKRYRHGGIKKMLLYYAYARYSIKNGYNDTPVGHVTKTNEFSIPKPLKEIQAFSDNYREMAYQTYKDIKNFLCINQDDYVNFNSADCASCGCSGVCGTKTVAKGYGIKSKNIGKWDV